MSTSFLSANFFTNGRGVTIQGATLSASTNLLNIINVADDFADDAAAAAGGVPIGGLYHNSGAVRVRLS